MPNQPGNEQNEISEAQLERWVYEAFRLAAKVAPESEEEIARLEQELAGNPTQLPASLQNAQAVYERITNRRDHQQPVMKLPVSSGATENLARAARDGKTIPPEIEKLMQQDRERAHRDKHTKE